MICKKNEAKVHLTQIIEGKVTKVDLCESCAKEKGVDDEMGFSLADLMMGLGASEGLAEGAQADQTKCPKCGFSQADFKKTGRLGCAECYSHFEEGLTKMLKGMHKGMRHTGKVPRQPRPTRSLADRIQKLQRQLEAAVAVEDYEEAARLRDEIKALREQAPAA
jgi:protein arginine kinase activator